MSLHSSSYCCRAYLEDLLARYPKAVVGDFDGDPKRLTEMDAMVAYLQILGRMVDFADYTTDDFKQ